MNRRTARPHGVPSSAHPLEPRGTSAGLVRKVGAIAPRRVTPGVDFSSHPAGLCPRTDSCLCPCSLRSPWGRWPRLLPLSTEGTLELPAERGEGDNAPVTDPCGPERFGLALRAAGAGSASTGAQVLSPRSVEKTPGSRPEPQRRRDPLAVPEPGRGDGDRRLRRVPRATAVPDSRAGGSGGGLCAPPARCRPAVAPRLGSARPSRRSAPRTHCTLPGVVRYC